MGATEAIPALFSAGVIAALGIAIKYFGMVNLIAGYDPEKVTDEEGLADFVGTNSLYISGLTFIIAVVEYTQPFERYRYVWFAYLSCVGLLTVWTVWGAQRYSSG